MTAIRFLRVVAGLEGLSYAALVFVAMPLKYGWGEPSLVRVLGMLHGVLFVAFLVAVARAARARRWNALQISHALAASIVPFATIGLDATLREEEAERS